MMGTWVSYRDEQQPLEGYLAAPDSAHDLPGVLVVPSWLNVNESICRRADRLAELDYVAFVADLFGTDHTPPRGDSRISTENALLFTDAVSLGRKVGYPWKWLQVACFRGPRPCSRIMDEAAS